MTNEMIKKDGRTVSLILEPNLEIEKSLIERVIFVSRVPTTDIRTSGTLSELVVDLFRMFPRRDPIIRKRFLFNLYNTADGVFKTVLKSIWGDFIAYDPDDDRRPNV